MTTNIDTRQTTLPARRKNGRPSKFTPPTRARLVELVAKGVPYRHACHAVRITYQSFNNYREENPDFKEELDLAVAAAIEKRLAIIEKAAEAGDVNCAKWMLEHLHPESFARNRIEVSGPEGSPLAGAIAVYLPTKDGAPKTVVEVNGKEVEDAG